MVYHKHFFTKPIVAFNVSSNSAFTPRLVVKKCLFYNYLCLYSILFISLCLRINSANNGDVVDNDNFSGKSLEYVKRFYDLEHYLWH